MPEKSNLTLYTAIGDFGRVFAAFREAFAPVTRSAAEDGDADSEARTGENTLHLLLRDNTGISLHLQHDPAFLAKHVQGMAGFFMRAETDNGELKQSVLNQILSFNCLAGLEFERNEDENRTNFITNALFEVARRVNGLLLFPSMRLYTARGELLLSPDGGSDLERYNPVANADLLDGAGPEAEEDAARRLRSTALLRARAVPCMEHLRSAVKERDAAVRAPLKIARRAAALFGVAVFSELMCTEHDVEQARHYFGEVDRIHGIRQYLSPLERAYIESGEPEESACVRFAWRYECCAVLLWALGRMEELPYPSEICDVPAIARILWAAGGPEGIAEGGRPRSDAELLDAADLTLRYDWACVDARAQGRPAPAGLDGGVVMERHYAFNWLIGANDGAGWDEIRTDT